MFKHEQNQIEENQIEPEMSPGMEKLSLQEI